MTLLEKQDEATRALITLLDDAGLNPYTLGFDGEPILKERNKFFISYGGLDHVITVETEDPR